MDKRKSALQKVAEPKKSCLDPEHNPPGNIVLEPGSYEHICPKCGKVSRFIIPDITL